MPLPATEPEALERKEVEKIIREQTSVLQDDRHRDGRHRNDDKTAQPEGVNNREAQDIEKTPEPGKKNDGNMPGSTPGARRARRTPYAESQRARSLSKRRTTYTTKTIRLCKRGRDLKRRQKILKIS